jgi:hypothetical protein
MKPSIPLMVILIAAGPASALPPPPGCCAEVGWDGPGTLCEENFTLAVEPDEFVREDIQLEPWYPISNTVKSPHGWYSITVRDRSRSRLQPTDSLRIVRKDGQGRLFQY